LGLVTPAPLSRDLNERVVASIRKWKLDARSRSGIR